eukprot:3111882-Amphidinium_carterae.1
MLRLVKALDLLASVVCCPADAVLVVGAVEGSRLTAPWRRSIAHHPRTTGSEERMPVVAAMKALVLEVERVLVC